MNKIMLVEDDIGLNKGIAMGLRSESCQFLSCFHIKEAEGTLERERVDLIILDINLPDGNGIDFLQRVKQSHSRIPVILLTAKDTEMDVVTGLAAGADDYVTKPFSLSILRARVEVQLRRTEEEGIVILGKYRFDFSSQVFECDGKKVELSQTEQKILSILIKHRGSTVAREQIQSYVWGNKFLYVDDNSLSVAVKRLRTKLKDAEYIKTVYGIGYSWEEGAE